MTSFWIAEADGDRIEVELRGGSLYLEDGPAAWPARGHESGGGTFTIEEIRRRPPFIDRYPGFYDRLMADFTERFRVVDAPRGVLCTIAADVVPHAVPCCFAIEGDVIHTPVDRVKAKTTTALGRLADIEAVPEVCLLVDHYEDDWSRLWWTRIDGRARVLDSDEHGFTAGSERLQAKYPQYEGTTFAAMIEIEVLGWTTWPRDPEPSPAP